MASVYVTYYPDLAVPGAVDTVGSFVEMAVARGIRRLVLLSGRGEEEAQRTEQVLQEPRADWTILRCSMFSQNFSEYWLRDPVVSGEVVLPVAGNVKEPFLDANDIADVAVAALTDDRHVGQLYELTGPRLLTFPEAVEEISKAVGREIRYVQVSAEQYTSALEAELPPEFVWLVNYIFTTVLDGRNAHLTDGVQRALGREPRDFADYARDAAGSGIWGGVSR